MPEHLLGLDKAASLTKTATKKGLTVGLTTGVVLVEGVITPMTTLYQWEREARDLRERALAVAPFIPSALALALGVSYDVPWASYLGGGSLYAGGTAVSLIKEVFSPNDEGIARRKFTPLLKVFRVVRLHLLG